MLRGRFEPSVMRKFELALHPDKTRLIRFGRHAAKQREKLSEMSEAEFTSFLSTFLGCAKAHSRDGTILFVFMDWRHLFELTCAGREQGLVAKNLIVWAKDNAGMGTFYRSKHELLFVFKNGDAAHTNTFAVLQ